MVLQVSWIVGIGGFGCWMILAFLVKNTKRVIRFSIANQLYSTFMWSNWVPKKVGIAWRAKRGKF
ncbi:hypothetical protein HanOQP8_Chr09g0317091 [Helianthus annuus]|nr:hypothetical protein HanHA89_Chr09g0331931 [Helianthus annuus]KAJ0706812.1 hypothetical protein HanLR1_Chr09g0311371 [Helianthus annuus]KAJ0710845.1 hypothetical protein HanOQP8_Chr09g0317091 [Helianthus annuus]